MGSSGQKMTSRRETLHLLQTSTRSSCSLFLFPSSARLDRRDVEHGFARPRTAGCESAGWGLQRRKGFGDKKRGFMLLLMSLGLRDSGQRWHHGFGPKSSSIPRKSWRFFHGKTAKLLPIPRPRCHAWTKSPHCLTQHSSSHLALLVALQAFSLHRHSRSDSWLLYKRGPHLCFNSRGCPCSNSTWLNPFSANPNSLWYIDDR